MTCADSGFITISPHWWAQHKDQVLASNGVVEVKHNVAFKIWIGNFGDHDVTFPKSLRVTLAKKPPPFIAETNGDVRREEDAIDQAPTSLAHET